MSSEREQRRSPQAQHRLHGQRSESRHQGVYQPHRHSGLSPHPHTDAATRLEQRSHLSVGVHGERVAGQPLHHYLHTPTERHCERARPAPLLEAGQVISYDPASATALVQTLGSPARLLGPLAVAAGVPSALLVAGTHCLTVLLDPHNPADGVVAAVWG